MKRCREKDCVVCNIVGDEIIFVDFLEFFYKFFFFVFDDGDNVDYYKFFE